MQDLISHRLFHGPYACPRVRIGQKLDCEYRGREVIVGGMSDAPIPWPYARQGGPRSPIVFGSLIKAIQRESEVAVAFHWGVSAGLVWQWRRALGVPRDTDGTKRVQKHYMGKLAEISKKPEIRRRKSRIVKRLMREGLLRPGNGRPFSAKEITKLGTDTDRNVAKTLGRNSHSIQWKRKQLGIPAYQDPNRANPRRYKARELALLGTASDAEIAQRLGRHRTQITIKRRALGIPSFLAKTGAEHRPFKRWEIARLGKASDVKVGKQLGRNPMVIRWKRIRLGIPPYRPMTPPRPFSRADIALLGTDTDRAIGQLLDRGYKNVQWKRKQLGIPAFTHKRRRRSRS